MFLNLCVRSWRWAKMEKQKGASALAKAGLACQCPNRPGLPATGFKGSIDQGLAVAVPDDNIESILQVGAQQVLEEEENFHRRVPRNDQRPITLAAAPLHNELADGCARFATELELLSWSWSWGGQICSSCTTAGPR